MKTKESIRIRFIGAGNMACSLIGGLMNRGFTSAQMSASEPNSEQAEYVKNTHKIQVYAENDSSFGFPDVVILAVKPQIMKPALKQAADKILAANSLVISVAAGITTSQISSWIAAENNCAVVRTMPNTPALIGQGAIGMFANAHVNDKQKSLTDDLMRAVGTALWVNDESLIDVVTALSGSGPAYFFAFMQAMQSAAESMGLSKEQAHTLTLKTASGSALLAERSTEDLDTLTQRVTSPNGTTFSALASFEANNLKAIVGQAMQAAKQRSIELSEAHTD